MSNSIVLSDGRKLAYDLRGPQGSPVILLSNSLLTDYALWNHFIADADFRDFRFLRYDQAGHGNSSAPEDPTQTTFVTLANDVVELLKALDIQNLHSWIGISMGAATGVYFVTQNPGVVKRLVLADTITSSPINAGVPDAFVARAEIARKDSDAIEKLTEAALERWFSQQWRDANQVEVQRMRELMKTTSRNGFIACCNALSHQFFDLRPMLRNVGLSVDATLLLAGERDANLPETMEVMRQEISAGSNRQPQERLVIIKDAGHVPVVDGFNQFKLEVLDFLLRKSSNKI